MRQGLNGAERVLVDPQDAARRTGVPHAINYFMPSWDGAHLAYGMSAGGSEDASLHVLHVASGKPVGRPVPRVHDTPLHWLPDSRSLTFTQLARLKPGAPDTDTYKDSRVLWLRLGGTPRPVFGRSVTPGLGLVRLDVAELITAPGSPWVVARTTDTTVPEGKLFVAPLARLGQPGLRWQRIASEADKVVDVALQGDGLFVMTQAGAPHRKIVRLDLNRPGLANAELAVAEPADGVLEGFQLTPAGLVTEVRQGTSVLLRRHARAQPAAHWPHRPRVRPGWPATRRPTPRRCSTASTAGRCRRPTTGWTASARCRWRWAGVTCRQDCPRSWSPTSPCPATTAWPCR